MKLLSMFLGACVCLSPLVDIKAHAEITPPIPGGSSSGSSITRLIGNFTLLGAGAKNSVVLSNNIFYRPTREKEVKLLRNWEIDDTIRLLATGDDDRFILVNLRTGESIKTKIYKWH